MQGSTDIRKMSPALPHKCPRYLKKQTKGSQSHSSSLRGKKQQFAHRMIIVSISIANISSIQLRNKIVEFVSYRKHSGFLCFGDWWYTEGPNFFALIFVIYSFISIVFICFIPECKYLICLFLRLWGVIHRFDSKKEMTAREGISLYFSFLYLLRHGFDHISLFQQFSDSRHNFDFCKLGQFYVHRCM